MIGFESDEATLQKLRERLGSMTDAELIQFGKTVRGLSEGSTRTSNPFNALVAIGRDYNAVLATSSYLAYFPPLPLRSRLFQLLNETKQAAMCDCGHDYATHEKIFAMSTEG